MKNTLLVGDPHCTVSNLTESIRLFDFIFELAKEERVCSVVILGDLFHNHALLRSEVVSFWDDVFNKLSTLNKPIVVLKGNHEELGNSNNRSVHALKVFKNKIKNVNIVDEPFLCEKTLYIGHDTDSNRFIDTCKEYHELGADEVVAHQNFTEDLFGDKIDPDLVPQKSIISGHIHDSDLSRGKVFYAGVPRWDKVNAANKDKGVWFVNGNDREFISTKSVCQVIKKYTVLEGEELPNLDPKDKNYLELEGSNAWITLIKKKMKGVENIQIKGVPTDVRVSSEKKNIKTIYDFLDSKFKPIDGVLLEDIKSYIGAFQ
jgi:DNA repair exonuclease SbcCD nuclease subunit